MACLPHKMCISSTPTSYPRVNVYTRLQSSTWYIPGQLINEFYIRVLPASAHSGTGTRAIFVLFDCCCLQPPTSNIMLQTVKARDLSPALRGSCVAYTSYIPRFANREPCQIALVEFCARKVVVCLYIYIYFKSVPFIIFALLVLLPISRNPDPGPHSRLFSPLPTTVRAFHFYREKDSALPSRVDSHRIVPTTHAIVGALDSWCHLRI